MLLVAANGFFVATEFAIARIRPTQVTELEAAGKPGARALRHAVDHIDACIPPAREVGHAPHTEVELVMLLQESLREGLIEPEELEFAENVFEFGDRRARQIMVPRGEIDYIARVPDSALVTRLLAELRREHRHLALVVDEHGTTVGLVSLEDILETIVGYHVEVTGVADGRIVELRFVGSGVEPRMATGFGA